MKIVIVFFCMLIAGGAFAANDNLKPCNTNDAACVAKKLQYGCKDGDEACIKRKRAENMQKRRDTSMDFDMNAILGSVGISEPKATPEKAKKPDPAKK